MAEQRRDPRPVISVTCCCDSWPEATTTNVSRHGLRLRGPMNVKVGDRFVIEVDVEGGLPLSTKVRHVTEGDIGLELDEPNRRWVRWVIERGGEQRSSPRQDRRLLAWLHVTDGVLGMWTADISCSGAYLLSDSSFELGEVLELELVDDTNATLQLRCRVIRRGAPGIGVRFIDLDDERRGLLDDLLQAA